mmetsp:Transcript_42798/g.114979  ORF Transcript_42798/g.114979 Transcript_42798/m.114979 type:complete len:249 (+) Transcript_42798:1108-1854(+)
MVCRPSVKAGAWPTLPRPSPSPLPKRFRRPASTRSAWYSAPLAFSASTLRSRASNRATNAASGLGGGSGVKILSPKSKVRQGSSLGGALVRASQPLINGSDVAKGMRQYTMIGTTAHSSRKRASPKSPLIHASILPPTPASAKVQTVKNTKNSIKMDNFHLGGAFGQSDDPSVAPGAANCDTSTLPTAWSNTLRSEVRPMALPFANHSANSGESIHLRMTGYERNLSRTTFARRNDAGVCGRLIIFRE